MTAKEATPQDWEALKNRIERRHTGVFAGGAEETAIRVVDDNLANNPIVRPENWPGTEDTDLWIKVLNRNRRQNAFQRETDQALRAANNRRPQDQRTDAEEWDKSMEDELIMSFGFFLLCVGTAVGILLTLLVTYIL